MKPFGHAMALCLSHVYYFICCCNPSSRDRLVMQTQSFGGGGQGLNPLDGRRRVCLINVNRRSDSQAASQSQSCLGKGMKAKSVLTNNCETHCRPVGEKEK